MMRFNLIAGCFLSLSVHAGFFLLSPAPSSQPLVLPDTPTDAELLVLDIPAPPTMPLPASPQPPSLDEGSQPLPSVVAYDATKIVPPDMESINGAIEKMSAGMSIQLPMPVLQLPTRNNAEDTSALLDPPRALTTATAAMLEQSLLAPGLPTGVDKHIGWGQVRLGEKQSPSRVGLPKLDRKFIALSAPPTPSPSLPLPPLPSFGIKGPAAKREPLYRPPLPKVRVQAEGEITLKFWVRPDGVVSRVLPERKGEAALEAAAIRYIEGWRFTPIPSYELQSEQWGTITVRFLRHQR